MFTHSQGRKAITAQATEVIHFHGHMEFRFVQGLGAGDTTGRFNDALGSDHVRDKFVSNLNQRNLGADCTD